MDPARKGPASSPHNGAAHGPVDRSFPGDFDEMENGDLAGERQVSLSVAPAESLSSRSLLDHTVRGG
jgi:hypothetical protein